MIQSVRSVSFDVAAYVLTFAYMILLAPMTLIMPRWFTQKTYRGWVKSYLWCLSKWVGLKFQVEGKETLENALAQGPHIIASKHQSAWDTIIFALFVDPFTIVLKKELMNVPVFSWYLKKLGCIGVDRRQGIKSIKRLIVWGKNAVQEKLSILIFPEGTRSKPGDESHYNPGVAAMYGALDVPVIPVALNSGVFWGRRSAIKKPGTITIKFLDPIEPGLDKKDFLQKLQHLIDTESNRLVCGKM
jgi:1-acyl-sn-glycerol-3-phosphate acyltransferase